MTPLAMPKVNMVMTVFYIALVSAALSFGWQYSATVNMLDVVVGAVMGTAGALTGFACVYIGGVKTIKMSKEGFNS